MRQKPNKLYVGSRHGGKQEGVAARAIVTVNGQLLNPRTDLRNHSPDGFNWGYGGSGPAQLALALLADCTGDDGLALAFYQEFKARVVVKLDRDKWEMTTRQLEDLLLELQRAELQERVCKALTYGLENQGLPREVLERYGTMLNEALTFLSGRISQIADAAAMLGPQGEALQDQLAQLAYHAAVVQGALKTVCDDHFGG